MIPDYSNAVLRHTKVTIYAPLAYHVEAMQRVQGFYNARIVRLDDPVWGPSVYEINGWVSWWDGVIYRDETNE